MAGDSSQSEQSFKMDLSYLGQDEARYVQKQMHIVLSKTNNLLNTLLQDNITPAYLHYWLYKYHGPCKQEQGTAHYIVGTYREIYEMLAKRIHYSLRHPLAVPLPALKRWLQATDEFTKERDWRNIIAHNAGVPAPYKRFDEDRMVNRRFDPRAFLEEGVPILRELKDDLELFSSWLEEEIDEYPVLEVKEPVIEPYNEQWFHTELKEEGHPEVLQLDAEQAYLKEQTEYFQEEADRIKNFCRSLGEDMSEPFRQQASAAEAKMYDVAAQKSALLKQIWTERQAVVVSSNSWSSSEYDDTYGGWDESGWHNGTTSEQTASELWDLEEADITTFDTEATEGTVSTSSLAGDIGCDAMDTIMEGGQRSWSFKKVIGRLLKAFARKIRDSSA
ncbi:hypothetical protein E8E11_005038 [Didymella keratinophila]|nr:hypothetical protein E8E11_005038 [Didymella keratinophila]